MLPASVLGSKPGKKEGLFHLIEPNETFGPFVYPIDDFAVKSYAYAQNNYHPWSFSDDNPFGKRIGQAGIMNNDLLWVFMDHFDCDTVVGLHTHAELWFHSPVFVGEQITTSGVYSDTMVRNNWGYVTLNAKCVGEDGRPLVTYKGMEIMRILGLDLPEEKNRSKPDADRVTGEYDASIPEVSKAAADVTIGAPIAKRIHHASLLQTLVFSRADVVNDSTHVSKRVAKESGYPGVVVQGQQQVSLMTDYLCDFFGESWYTTGHQKAKMIRPLNTGETITIQGMVRDKKEENGKTRLYLHVWVKNSAGDIMSVGWADAEV